MHYSHPAFTGYVGFAQADITPPIGIYARNWGAAAHDVAEGIHRPLFARVLTLQQRANDKPFLLISLDLGWWKLPEDEWSVRGALLQEFGLPESQVLINLTHTHSGPVFCSGDTDKPGGEFILPYLKKLQSAVIAATREALDKSTFSTLEWATGKCNLAQYRDLPDPEKPRTVCGFNPAADAEDMLLVGRVTAANGDLICVLANYACHGTTLAWQNKLISPDWMGGYYALIAETLGVPAMFLQGSSGELQPRDAYTGNTEIADQQGRQFAYAVLGILEGMLPPRTQLEYDSVVESGAPLAMWRRQSYQGSQRLKANLKQVELPLKEMESSAELEVVASTTQDRVLRERAIRKMRVRRMVGEGKSTFSPLWIWEVGDAVFVAHRGETYAIYQQTLRQQFPEKAVIVMNLTNGTTGYLPPAALYGQDIYQVWQTILDRGCAEIFLQETQRGIADILKTS